MTAPPDPNGHSRRRTTTWSSSALLGVAAVLTALWLGVAAPTVSPVSPVAEGGVLTAATDVPARNDPALDVTDGADGRLGRDGDGVDGRRDGRRGRGGDR